MGQIQPIATLGPGIKYDLPRGKVTIADQTDGVGSRINVYASLEGIAQGFSDYNTFTYQNGQLVIDGRLFSAIMVTSGLVYVLPYTSPNMSYYKKLLNNFSYDPPSYNYDDSVAAGTSEFAQFFIASPARFLRFYYDFQISESSGTNPTGAYISLTMGGMTLVKKVCGYQGYPRIGMFEQPGGVVPSNTNYEINIANGDSVAHTFHIAAWIAKGTV